MRAALRGGGGLVPCVVLWLWWALDDGGYSPSLWLAGLPLLAVLCAALAMAVPRPALRGPRAWAIAAFAALAAWTWISVAWAGDPGAAVVDAERRSLYLAAFALPVLWPPSRNGLRLGLLALPLVATASAAAAFAAAFAEDGLVDGRLVGPFLYPNALAAMLAVGALVSLALAGLAGSRVALRAACWAGTGTLAGASLLTQSRGGLAALVLAAAALIALAPFRARLVAPAIAAGIGVALAAPSLLAVRNAALQGSADSALALAGVTLLGLAAGLAMLALVASALERADFTRRIRAGLRARIPAPPSIGRRTGAGVAIVAIVAACASLVLVDGPRGWVGDRVDDFETPNYTQVNSASTRFAGGLGSNRADYWRVAVDTAAADPVGGVGAGGFGARYLRDRESELAPRYAHSVWLGTAAELGIVGAALLVGLLVALATAGVAAVRSSSEGERVVRVAALVPLGYLGVHASFDWVDAFPALAVPALGLAGAALAPLAIREHAVDAEEQRRRPLSLGVAAALTALALIAVPLLTAERLTEGALSANASDAPRTEVISALDRAAGLDPLSPRAPLAKGLICAQRGEYRCARVAFGDAAGRDPAGWMQQLGLGLLATDSGERERARRRIAMAQALNRREPLVGRAAEALEGAPKLTPRRAAVVLLGRSGLGRVDRDG